MVIVIMVVVVVAVIVKTILAVMLSAEAVVGGVFQAAEHQPGVPPADDRQGDPSPYNPKLPEVTLLPVPGGDPDPEPEQQHAVLLVAGRHGSNQVTAAGRCRVSHCSAAGPRWRLCCRRQTLTGTVACPWQSSSTSGTPRRPWTSKYR